MRVISQDGTIDIQYENYVIAITGDIAIAAGRDIIDTPLEWHNRIIARYSRSEKALRAMALLHDHYERVCKMQAGCESVMLPSMYFKFPEDSEV